MPLGATDISMIQIAASGSLSSDNIDLETIYKLYVNSDATGNFGLDDMANQDYPTVATNAASSVTSTSMTCNGNVSATGNILGGVSQRGFYFGTSTNYASNTKVSAGNGTGAYTLSRTSLSSGTTFYITAYAINALGERQGSTVTQATSAALTSFQYTTVSSGPPAGSTEAACSLTVGEDAINATGYHDGSAAFPDNGDSVYTDSGGSSAFVNGFYRMSVPEGKSTVNKSFQVVSGEVDGSPSDC